MLGKLRNRTAARRLFFHIWVRMQVGLHITLTCRTGNRKRHMPLDAHWPPPTSVNTALDFACSAILRTSVPPDVKRRNAPFSGLQHSAVFQINCREFPDPGAAGRSDTAESSQMGRPAARPISRLYTIRTAAADRGSVGDARVFECADRTAGQCWLISTETGPTSVSLHRKWRGQVGQCGYVSSSPTVNCGTWL